jgi:hypothetical protein
MKLFAGLRRTDYEDVFRAVGALIDERGWSNISLSEVDEGVVLQVLVRATVRDVTPRLETYLLTDADLERILRDAILRRKKQFAMKAEPEAAPPVPAPSSGPLTSSTLVEERLAALMSQSRDPRPVALPPESERELSPLPSFEELSDDRLPAYGEAPHGAARASDADPDVPIFDEDELDLFSPAPMRLATATPAPAYDAGAARAAVVMAHIVAARIRSGVPISGDDPDLASLLEQVRALDEAGIGRN